MAEEQKTILAWIRDAVGINEVTAFDTEILIHINGAVNDLIQVGVPMTTPVTDKTLLDDMFLKEIIPEKTQLLYEECKQYIFLICKVYFDAPAPNTQNLMEAKAKECLWRAQMSWEEVSDE